MGKLIKPFIYGKMNQCPECGGKLELVEEETYVAAIDSKGVPIGGESFVDMRLRCMSCRKEYDAQKKGMHYMIDHHCAKIVPIARDYNPFYE